MRLNMIAGLFGSSRHAVNPREAAVVARAVVV
jgi:hypothetical protein